MIGGEILDYGYCIEVSMNPENWQKCTKSLDSFLSNFYSDYYLTETAEQYCDCILALSKLLKDHKQKFKYIKKWDNVFLCGKLTKWRQNLYVQSDPKLESLLTRLQLTWRIRSTDEMGLSPYDVILTHEEYLCIVELN